MRGQKITEEKGYYFNRGGIDMRRFGAKQATSCLLYTSDAADD